MACLNYMSSNNGTMSINGDIVGYIKSFNVDTSVNMDQFATNTTGGWTAAVAGAKSASGTFSYAGNDDMTSTPVDVGDCVEGVFTVTTGSTYTGSITISTEGVPVGIENGSHIVWEFGWVNDGPLVKTGNIVKSGS